MDTVLKEMTKDEVRSVIRFFWAKGIQPVEIDCELVKVYDPGVMAVQHVRKGRREFEKRRVSVADQRRSGRPSIFAEHVEDIDAAVWAGRRLSLQL
jgi:hypothetical protein